jgi:hypothetical protein
MSLSSEEIDVLNFISTDDPFGLLDKVIEDEKKKKAAVKDSNPIIKAFSEINDFYDKNGRLPERCDNSEERKLAIHFQSIIDDESKIEVLKSSDKYNLFVKEENKVISRDFSNQTSIEDIFDDELSAQLLDIDDDENDLFDFSNGISTSKERAQADFVAKRKPCRDFKKYKPLFEDIQNAIDSKHRKIIPFSETHLHVGGFYVYNGIIFYLESMDSLTPKGKRYDGRTHCVYSNGTESNIFYQSIVRGLLISGGQSITEDDRADAGVLFDRDTIKIGEDDRETGYLYVLMSLSQKETIKAIPNLYKIGFTTKSVESRISKASKEATYLNSDVRIVATWKCYNTKTQKVEDIIHQFLKPAQIVFTISGDERIADATEWFSVPLPVIKETIERISDRTIVNYYFNKISESLEKK